MRNHLPLTVGMALLSTMCRRVQRVLGLFWLDWGMLQLPLPYAHCTVRRGSAGAGGRQAADQRLPRLQGQWSKSMSYDKGMLWERPINLVRLCLEEYGSGGFLGGGGRHGWRL